MNNDMNRLRILRMSFGLAAMLLTAGCANDDVNVG